MRNISISSNRIPVLKLRAVFEILFSHDKLNILLSGKELKTEQNNT
jgi:hypothetical protein